MIYWMSRDQRSELKIDAKRCGRGCEDNWALLYSQKSGAPETTWNAPRLAIRRSSNLHVAFCLVPKFLDATIRQPLGS